MCRNLWLKRRLLRVPFPFPLRLSLGDFAAGLPEELLLCPLRSLSAYMTSTSQVVNRPRRLFVSPRCPSRAVSKNGISYMPFFVICHSIVQNGASSQSVQAPRAHSIRGIAIHLLFSATGLCGVSWRQPLGVQILFLHLFTCGIYNLH